MARGWCGALGAVALAFGACRVVSHPPRSVVAAMPVVPAASPAGHRARPAGALRALWCAAAPWRPRSSCKAARSACGARRPLGLVGLCRPWTDALRSGRGATPCESRGFVRLITEAIARPGAGVLPLARRLALTSTPCFAGRDSQCMPRLSTYVAVCIRLGADPARIGIAGRGPLADGSECPCAVRLGLGAGVPTPRRARSAVERPPTIGRTSNPGSIE